MRVMPTGAIAATADMTADMAEATAVVEMEGVVAEAAVAAVAVVAAEVSCRLL
jgi:hypothetical protein